jgi:molybdate transport repressor ModE-like protein
MELQIELRWRLAGSGREGLDPALLALLQAIEQTGSVRAGAEQCGISYRYAWGLLRKWERLLGGPLASLQRGKGARLARLGERLVWGQRRTLARLAPELESLASELNAELRIARASEEMAPVRVYASHGLALGVLRDLLHRERGVRLDLQFRGSLESLRLLSGGRCDLAGFHIPEGALGRQLAPRFRHWLHPENQVLIQLVYRQQGLMCVRGEAAGVHSLPDLTRAGVRFVNRQAGSGTRLIFDALLEEAGVPPESIHGYPNEEFTHMAVAALIAGGAADAGFGIEAAARQFGLAFIPMVRERYLFALRRETLQQATVGELMGVIRSGSFRDQVGALPGYDARDAGTVCELEEVMPSAG